MGSVVPIIATSYGAKIIEKHFILDKSLGGPDSSFSLDENEFSEMVSNVRKAEKCIGKIDYNLTNKQKQGLNFARSLYVVKDIKKGDELTNNNIRSIRPGFGLHPKFLPLILNKKVKKNLYFGDRLNINDIEM